MKKVRFGIVGLGNQGSYYACELFQKGEIEEGELTALCDVDIARAEAVQKRAAPQAVCFSEFDKMLASGLVDAVLIETPHYLHPAMARACFQRGIAVLCDKPAGVYTRQVRRMNEEATRSGVLFSMMFNQRTDCIFRRMRSLIKEGAIGRLQRVNYLITDWFRPDCYYASGDWRATWAGEGGGVLINQCPHQLDLVQWVVGESPSAVRALVQYGRWHDIEVEDEVTAFFEYASGATGVFVTTTGETPGTNRFEVSGTKGKLLSENGRLFYYENAVDSMEFLHTAAASFSRPAVTVTEVTTDGQNPRHAGIINNFARAYLKKEPLFVDGCEGLMGVELMNAITLSGWKGGERVLLPVSGEEYERLLRERCASSTRRGTRYFQEDKE